MSHPPLYPFQVHARQHLYRAWKAGPHRDIIALPTGTGKTRAGLSVAADAVRRGRRVLWMAAAIELIDQPLMQLAALWPDVAEVSGAVQATRDDVSARLVVATVGTLTSRDRLAQVLAHGPIDLLVVDECHHSIAADWWRVITEIEDHAHASTGARPYVLGLSATPYRGDGRPLLGDAWRMAYAMPTAVAVADGYLVPVANGKPTLNIMPRGDLSTVGRTASGDYSPKALGAILDVSQVVEHCVRSLVTHAKGRRCVSFTLTIEQAKFTAAALRDEGWRAEHVSGKTPAPERRRILADLAAGRLDCVTNAAVLTEGWDCPSVDCVSIDRAVGSLGAYVQMAGRGLRLSPGKTDCLIVDHGGASIEFDLMTAGHGVYIGVSEPGEQRKTEGGPVDESMITGGAYDGMLRERHRRAYAWQRVPELDRGAYVLDLGEAGQMYALQTEAGGWRAVFHARRGDGARSWDPLVYVDVTESIALDVATAQARTVDRAATLARRGASWRSQAPTMEQGARLRQMRQDVPGTRGEAAEALTARLAMYTLTRAGHAERLRPEGT